MQTHLIFRVRKGSLLHSFVEGHEVCQTLVPEEEKRRREHVHNGNRFFIYGVLSDKN